VLPGILAYSLVPERQYKTPYKIRNWRAYEAGLRQRGSVTVWITADAKRAWCHRGRWKPGGKRVYSDVAIETFWMISMIYGLALRQTEGFIESVFELAGVTLSVPDHSTVSRRVRKLGKVPMMPRGSKGPIHLLVDSSVAADLTASNACDAARVPALLGQIESELASFSGDGAYDQEPVYEAVEEQSPDRRTRVIIPPQKGAVLSPESVTALRERNRHIRSIHRIGRREWHLWSGFTKRSRVENVVHRYKAILGREMKARTVAGQRVEARLGCRILNKMAKLGMPESYRAG